MLSQEQLKHLNDEVMGLKPLSPLPEYKEDEADSYAFTTEAAKPVEPLPQNYQSAQVGGGFADLTFPSLTEENNAPVDFQQAFKEKLPGVANFVGETADRIETALSSGVVNEMQEDLGIKRLDAWKTYTNARPEILREVRNISIETGIPEKVILYSPDSLNRARNIYNYRRKQMALSMPGGKNDPGMNEVTIDQLTEAYPGLDKIINADSVTEAAIALENIENVRHMKGILDAGIIGYQRGLKQREMQKVGRAAFESGRDITEEEMKRYRELEDEYKTMLEAPDFFDNPMVSLVGRTAEQAPQQAWGLLKGTLYGGVLAGTAAGATAAISPLTGGASLAAAPAAAKWGFGVGMRVGYAEDMWTHSAAQRYLEYSQYKDENGKRVLTNAEAQAYAAVAAALETGIEFANADTIVKVLKGNKSVAANQIRNIMSGVKDNASFIAGLKQVLSGMKEVAFSETLEEGAQEVSDRLLSNAANAVWGGNIPTYSPSEIAMGGVEAMAEAFLPSVGFAAMAGGSSSFKMVRRAAAMAEMNNNGFKEYWKNVNGIGMINRLLDDAGILKYFKDDPDVARKTLQGTVEGTDYETVNIDTEYAMKKEGGEQALREVAEAAGMSEDTVQAAIDTKATIAVPTAVYLQTRVNTENFTLGDEVLSFSDEEPCLAREKEYYEAKKAELEAIMSSADARQVAQQTEAIDRIVKEKFDNEEDRELATSIIMLNPKEPKKGLKELQDEYQSKINAILSPIMETVRRATPDSISDAELRQTAMDILTGNLNGTLPDYLNTPEMQEFFGANAVQVRELQDSLNRLGTLAEKINSIDAGELQTMEGMTNDAVEVYRQLSKEFAAGAPNTAVERSAKAGAALMARHADRYAEAKRAAGEKNYTAQDYLREKLGIKMGGEYEGGAGDTFFQVSADEFNRQKEDVVKQYKDTDLWMKAPNGNPTNLTEDQWVTVRTPAFKNWFGHWDLAAERAKLDKAVPVPVQENRVGATETEKPIANAIRQFNEMYPGGEVVPTVIGDVKINEESVSDSLSHKFSQAKLDAVLSLVEGMKTASYMGQMKDPTNKAKTNHYFVYKIKYGDGTRYVFVRGVQNFNNPAKLYVHEVYDEESIKKRSETISWPPDHEDQVQSRGIALYTSILNAFLNNVNSSKVVDENGEPLVVYHGTPYGGFEEFRKDRQAYFTPMKWYADKYHTPNASAIRDRYDAATQPQTYPVFLNIRKPFDTRNAAERKIWDEEYYRQWGTGAPLTDKGLPDWTDGLDLQEFFEENEYDYDGLILDEGGFPDGKGGVVSRGVSYVTFKPNQIKDATGRNVGFDPNNNNIYFQMAGSGANTANLVKLDQAMDMYENGESAHDIYEKTGWVRGKDERWRFEIPDTLEMVKTEKLRMPEVEGMATMQQLDDVYDNPMLYVAYPFLRDVKVIVLPGNADVLKGNQYNAAGYADYEKLEIGISEDVIKRYRENNAEWFIKDILLHETQHMIQEKEGFASGGNPDTVYGQIISRINKLEKSINFIHPDAKEYALLSRADRNEWDEKYTYKKVTMDNLAETMGSINDDNIAIGDYVIYNKNGDAVTYVKTEEEAKEYGDNQIIATDKALEEFTERTTMTAEDMRKVDDRVDKIETLENQLRDAADVGRVLYDRLGGEQEANYAFTRAANRSEKRKAGEDLTSMPTPHSYNAVIIFGKGWASNPEMRPFIEPPNPDNFIVADKSFDEQSQNIKEILTETLMERNGMTGLLDDIEQNNGEEARALAEDILYSPGYGVDESFTDKFSELEQMGVDENTVDKIDKIKNLQTKFKTGKALYEDIINFSGTSNAEARRKLADAGIDGIDYANAKEPYFESLLSEEGNQFYYKPNGSETYFQRQAGNGSVRGATEFMEDGKRILKVFESGNESTIAHEMGHIFLADLKDMAAMENAPAQIVKDWETVKEWLGWQPDQAELTTAQHEKFAQGFEAYLMSGEAPVHGLKKIFRQFKRWLTKLYKDFLFLGGKPSMEVAQVMGRMLATEEEVEAAFLLRGSEFFDKTGATSQLDATSLAMYQRWKNEATQYAEEKVLARAMKDLTEKRKQELDATRQKLTEDIQDRLLEEPVYKADALLEANPEMKNNWPAEQVGITYEEYQKQIKERGSLEEETTKMVDAAMQELEDKMPMAEIKEAAERAVNSSDYRSLYLAFERRFMLQKQMRTERLAEDVEKALDAIEQEIAAEEMDPAKVKAQLDALRSQTRWTVKEMNLINRMTRAAEQAEQKEALKNTITEFRGLVKDTREQVHVYRETAYTDRAIIRQYAEEKLAAMTIPDATNVNKWRSKGRVSGHQSANALKRALGASLQNSGTEKAQERVSELWKTANDLKTQQLVYEEMAAIAQKNADTVRKKNARLQARMKSIRKNKSMPAQERYMYNHGLFILGLEKNDAPVPQNKPDILRMFQYYADDMSAYFLDEDGNVWLPDYLIAAFAGDEVYKQNGYKSLKMEQYGEFTDALDTIYRVGMDANKNKVVKDPNGQEVNQDVIIDSVVAETEARVYARDNTDSTNAGTPTFGQRIINKALDAKVVVVKPETILEWMGPAAERYIYEPIYRASNKEKVMLGDVGNRVTELWSKYDLAERSEMRSKKQFNFGTSLLTREEMICVALNWGTEINKKRVLEGFRVTESTVMELLANMTEKDWKTVEGMWDIVNSFWDQTVEVEEAVAGIAPKKQEAVAFKVKGNDGNVYELKGGYYPIKYDATKSITAANREQDDVARQNMTRASMNRNLGFTKQRSSGPVKHPLLLSFDVFNKHIYDVVHNICYRLPLRDVRRILLSDKVTETLESHFGLAQTKALQQWSVDCWAPEKAGVGPMGQLMRFFRHKQTAAALGYNIKTALLNVLNLSPMAHYLGTLRTRQAIANFYENREENWNFCLSKSPFLRERAETMDRDAGEVMRDEFQGGHGKLLDGVEYGTKLISKSAFKAMAITDLALANPLWLAEYQRVFQDMMASAGQNVSDETIQRIDEEAISAGDKAVRKVFGSGEMKDLAPIQKGSELDKLFTMFYSYFNVVFNALYSGYAKGRMQSKMNNTAHHIPDIIPFIGGTDVRIEVRPLFDAFLYWTVYTGVSEGLMRYGFDALTGNDKDDDGWLEAALKGWRDNLFGTLPFVRDAFVSAMDIFMGERYYGARPLPGYAVLDNLQRIATAIRSDKKTKIDVFRESARMGNQFIGLSNTITDAMATTAYWADTDFDTPFYQYLAAVFFDKRIDKKKK